MKMECLNLFSAAPHPPPALFTFIFRSVAAAPLNQNNPRPMVGWPSNDALVFQLKLCGDVRIDDVRVKDSTRLD